MNDACTHIVRCGIILVDAESHTILDMNPAASEMLGWQKEEILGKTCQSVICPQEIGNCPLANGKGVKDNIEGTLLSRTGPISILKSVINAKIGDRKCYLESFVDISNVKSSEASLKESEQNFRQFFNTVDDLIFVADPEGKILFTNTAVTKKLGFTPEELDRMRVLDVHPRPYREDANKIFAAMFRGERDYCPLPLQTKDGHFLPVETRVWFGRWAGKDCIYGLSKDLTRLHAALEKFEKLFDNNPASMAVSGFPDRYFYEVNQAFIEKLGYTKSEVIGKTAKDIDLFVEPDKQMVVANQLRQTGQVKNIELKVKRKDGRILDGLFSGEIIDNQGVKSFLTVMTDISEIKELEREKRKSDELRQMHNFLENLLEYANASIVVLDAHFFIIRVNQAFESLIGTNAASLIGRNFTEFLASEQNHLLIEEIKKIADSTAKESIELPILSKDGSIRILLWNFAIIAMDDQALPITTIAQGQDITGRKQTERALEEKACETVTLNQQLQAKIDKQIQTEQQLRLLSSKLYETEEDQRRRIATYLHDEIIQNLVYANLKLGECRNMKHDENNPNPAREIQKYIQQSIKDLRTLTFELGSPILYELGFIPAIKWLIREHTAKHALKIEFLELDFPQTITEQQGIILFQALRELLNNILKYAHAEFARITAKGTSSNLHLLVYDNGIGFDRHSLELDINQNSGFGLVSIQERLRNLGGVMHISSTINEGTTIEIVLPKHTLTHGTKYEDKNIVGRGPQHHSSRHPESARKES